MESTPAISVPVPAALTFKVKQISALGTRGGLGGKVVFENGTLTLQSRGMFGIRKRIVPIPFAEIINVRQDGAKVVFDRQAAGTANSQVIIHARNGDDAIRIIQQLPTVTTPEFLEAFKREREKETAFAAELKAATPRIFVGPCIVIANVLVFIAFGLRGGGWFDADTSKLLAWGGDIWVYTSAGEWWRLFTSAFLHMGFIHLALNMYVLLIVAATTERLFGNLFFALIYLFGVIASGLASIWWDPHHVIVGASGAVFAVFGALLAYTLLQKAALPKRTVSHLAGSASAIVAYNIFWGLTHSGISNAAHIGGFVAGFVMGAVLCPPLDLSSRARLFLPRLIGAMAMAMVVLTAGIYRIPKSGVDMTLERSLRGILADVGTQESVLLKKYMDLLPQFDAKKISESDCANAIDQQIIPAWDSLGREFSGPAIGANSPYAKPVSALVAYWQVRRDAFHTMSDAMHVPLDNDDGAGKFQTLVTKSHSQWDQANQLASAVPSPQIQ